MWIEKLKKAQAFCKEYSFPCTDSGAPEEIISSWASQVQNTLGVRPPQEFLDVLRHANGFEWNGFILYGVDRSSFPTVPEYSVYGLIEQNEIWYEVENQRACLFLGESNISWYVWEIATGRYLELDNPSGQEMTVFDSCAEMLEKLLDDCLNCPNSPLC